MADAADGFVWRLQDDTGNATAVPAWDPDIIVNLSVWTSLEALRAYVFGPAHAAVLRQRRDYFVPMPTAHLVLWWVPAGHRPSLEEARDRLHRLDVDGPRAGAFTMRRTFAPPS